MARKPTGNPNGRPKKDLDEKIFKNLCAIQCTEEEIAGIFECSPDTVDRWCKRTYGEGFAETYKKHSQQGKVSLRRTQFKLAEKSAAMAIFLGKQYLGQVDNVTVNAPQADSMIETIAKQMFNNKPE